MADKSDGLRLGSFYFSWVEASKWSEVKDYGGLEPAIGYYNDALPATQEWHIKQAKSHGVSFWIFDWYYGIENNTQSKANAALDIGILQAKNSADMDFAVMWCNEDGLCEYTAAQLETLYGVLYEKYFTRQNYLKIGGRHVFAAAVPEKFANKIAGGEVTALSYLKNHAKKDGINLFFLAVSFGKEDEALLNKLKTAGFDALTGYSYNTETVLDEKWVAGNKLHADYSSILPWLSGKYDYITKNPDKAPKLIPGVSSGWDSRPWANFYGRGSWFEGFTPEALGEMCAGLLKYVDPELKMMTLGPWNEFGEGSYLEPTKKFGCAYLDAVAKAAFPDDYSGHECETPDGETSAKMCFAKIPSLSELVPPESGNLVPDHDFEGEYGWTTFNGFIEYSTDVFHSGTKSLRLTKAHRGIKSVAKIPLSADTDYEISVWVYGRARLVPVLYGEGQAFLSYNDAHAVVGGRQGEWTKLAVGMNLGDLETPDGGARYFDIHVLHIEGDDDIFVDDACALKRGDK